MSLRLKNHDHVNETSDPADSLDPESEKDLKKIISEKKLFHSGMKNVVQYLLSKNIKLGEKLTKYNVICKRPGIHTSADKIYQLLGKKVKRNIEEHKISLSNIINTFINLLVFKC